MIYSREKDIVQTLADQFENVSEIKQSQIIGNDNLKVTNYSENVAEAISVAAGVYAEYTATFTFTNPPSNALVTMSFSYNVSVSSGTMFKAEYTPPAFIDSSLQRKYIFRFAPYGAAATFIDLTCYLNSTEPGALSLVRTL